MAPERPIGAGAFPKPVESPAPDTPDPGQLYAALDLGTNSCRMLIAQPKGNQFHVVDSFSKSVQLGAGLEKTGRLSRSSMNRTIAALKVCQQKLKRHQVTRMRLVATEACRRARNARDFIRQVRRDTGLQLEIIQPEEEARLAVLGCHVLLEQGEGPALIFDIGGGSTELVLVQPGDKVPRIVDWLSVPWGGVSLTDTVQGSDTTEAERLDRYVGMRTSLGRSFAEFAERIRDYTRSTEPIRLLGTSGTVTTLASLHLELPQYDRRAVDGLIVPSIAMRDISNRLSRMSGPDRKRLPCIGDDRANLVIAGCAILESILDIWPAEQLGVADRGIREGILRSLIAADVEGDRSRATVQRMREQDV